MITLDQQIISCPD